MLMRARTILVDYLLVLSAMLMTMNHTGYAANSTSEPLVLYAAPAVVGRGDGSSIDDAAYFRDMSFWQTVNATLQNRPVTVNLLPGQYIFSKLVKDGQTRDTLRLYDFGHPEHQFVFQGLYKEGTVFTSDPDEPINADLAIDLLRFIGENAVFRNLHFTGQQHMSYTTHFRGKNILIEDCSFTDLINTYNGATGTAYEDSENITWRNNYFRRVGSNLHGHMIYSAYGPKHIYVIGNYFEDSSNDYVRFRDRSDYVVVYGNTFVSTGNFYHQEFLMAPLFNDDDPAYPGPDARFEYFGTHFLIADNTFIYPNDDSPGERYVFVFLHSGWDPPGRNLLLSPEEAQMLRTAPVEERKDFILENFGIDTDCVFFSNNIVQGRHVTNGVHYNSSAAFSAPSRGWRGYLDITPTVNTETVVRSEEEATAFWHVYIEGLKSFVAPKADDVVTKPLQVQIKPPEFALQSVEIALDGEPVYSGAALPTDFMLVPAQMTAGKHSLSLVLVDSTGKQYKDEVSFTVEHLTLADASRSQRVRGLTPFKFISHLTADGYQAVAIELTPFVDGERMATQLLYFDTVPPVTLEFDSLKFADGAYDLDVRYTTKHGVSNMISQRLVLDNWETLEDFILPPNPDTWFSSFERLLAVERSAGWEFTATQPEVFFGDGDRIKAVSTSEEHLTWELANLHHYQFILYARESDLEQAFMLTGSADGKEWLPLPYHTHVQEENAAGWRKVLVEGIVPAEQSIELIRFNLRGSTEVELGHVYLEGRIF
jgi:hypothetical protein